MADVIDFKTRRPVGTDQVERLANEQAAADDFEYYGFDPATLPPLYPIPEGTPFIAEVVEELRNTHLAMMSDTNRDHFRGCTGIWFWGLSYFIPTGANYFFDKVRKAEIQINSKGEFADAVYMPGLGLPKLQADNKGGAALRDRAEDLREELMCRRMSDEQVALFRRFDSITFWMTVAEAEEIDFDIAYENLTSGIERPLPAITGGTPGQIALAERLRDWRVPFFDDQTFERFGGQTDCQFWIGNMKQPICNFRKAAYDEPRRASGLPWIFEWTNDTPTGDGTSPATRKRWKRR